MSRADLLSDNPLSNLKQDKFGRDKFINAVVDVIWDQSSNVNPTNREELANKEDNLIIGIYGEWGVGKSSILSIMEGILKEDKGLLTQWFNPWMYNSELDLIINLYKTILNDPKLIKNENFQKIKDVAGNLLKSLEWVPVYGKYMKTSGDVISPLDFTSQQTTYELKEELEKLLAGTANPMVIFVDDVDRLSKDEIKVLFKTLRLIGSFKHVTYVVAFDDAMVAKSIKESYVDGTEEDGRGFIEKIIQLPLRIPEVKSEHLLSFTNELLFFYSIFIPKYAEDVFTDYVRTPRDVKRIVNSFRFISKLLPDLDQEELFLMESIRLKNAKFFYFFYLLYQSLDKPNGPHLFNAASHQHIRNTYPQFLLDDKKIGANGPHFKRLDAFFQNLTESKLTNRGTSTTEKNKLSNHKNLKKYFETLVETEREVISVNFNIHDLANGKRNS